MMLPFWFNKNNWSFLSLVPLSVSIVNNTLTMSSPDVIWLSLIAILSPTWVSPGWKALPTNNLGNDELIELSNAFVSKPFWLKN